MQDAADDPEAVRRFAGRMQAEATRLSALVHEIIELSRLQVAGALGQVGLVDVDTVLSEAVDRARTTAEAKHVRLDIGGVRGTRVLGQHDLLVTAVRNLLDNAVAYSGEASHVGVGVRTDGDLVEIAVVDQGIGITPAEQERVFERFYRVDPARSRDTGGTGPRPVHRQARRGGPRRRGDRLVAARPRVDVHAAPAPRARRSPPRPCASCPSPTTEGAHVRRSAS